MNPIESNQQFSDKMHIEQQLEMLGSPSRLFNCRKVNKEGNFEKITFFTWAKDRLKELFLGKLNSSSKAVIKKRFFEILVDAKKNQSLYSISKEKIQKAASSLGITPKFSRMTTNGLVQLIAQDVLSLQQAKPCRKGFSEKYTKELVLLSQKIEALADPILSPTLDTHVSSPLSSGQVLENPDPFIASDVDISDADISGVDIIDTKTDSVIETEPPLPEANPKSLSSHSYKTLIKGGALLLAGAVGTYVYSKFKPQTLELGDGKVELENNGNGPLEIKGSISPFDRLGVSLIPSNKSSTVEIQPLFVEHNEGLEIKEPISPFDRLGVSLIPSSKGRTVEIEPTIKQKIVEIQPLPEERNEGKENVKNSKGLLYGLAGVIVSLFGYLKSKKGGASQSEGNTSEVNPKVPELVDLDLSNKQELNRDLSNKQELMDLALSINKRFNIEDESSLKEDIDLLFNLSESDFSEVAHSITHLNLSKGLDFKNQDHKVKIEKLLNLGRISHLSIDCCGEEIDLGNLKYCKELELSNFKNSSLPVLESCEVLTLKNCSEINFVPELINCRHFKCYHCKNLEDLGGLQSCEKFYLESCHEIVRLPELPKCLVFKCVHCKKLEALPALPNCRQLYCNRCLISKLPKLPKCTDLICLNCPSLRKLPELTSCQNLFCQNCPALEASIVENKQDEIQVRTLENLEFFEHDLLDGDLMYYLPRTTKHVNIAPDRVKSLYKEYGKEFLDKIPKVSLYYYIKTKALSLSDEETQLASLKSTIPQEVLTTIDIALHINETKKITEIDSLSKDEFSRLLPYLAGVKLPNYILDLKKVSLDSNSLRLLSVCQFDEITIMGNHKDFNLGKRLFCKSLNVIGVEKFSLPELPICNSLYIEGSDIKKLPNLPECHRLQIHDCPNLKQLPKLPECSDLHLSETPKINVLPDLPKLKKCKSPIYSVSPDEEKEWEIRAKDLEDRKLFEKDLSDEQLMSILPYTTKYVPLADDRVKDLYNKYGEEFLKKIPKASLHYFINTKVLSLPNQQTRLEYLKLKIPKEELKAIHYALMFKSKNEISTSRVNNLPKDEFSRILPYLEGAEFSNYFLDLDKEEPDSNCIRLLSVCRFEALTIMLEKDQDKKFDLGKTLLCKNLEFFVGNMDLPQLPICNSLTMEDCNIKGLPELPECHKLIIYDCPKLEDLPELPKCRDIFLKNIAKIKKLPELPECVKLTLNNCPNLEDLPKLPKCVELTLSDCPKIAPLPNEKE